MAPDRYELTTNILVTGASSGIGAALVKVYAQRGASSEHVRIFLVARNAAQLRRVAFENAAETASRKVSIHWCASDLSSAEGCNDAVDAALRYFGHGHVVHRVFLNHGVLAFVRPGATDASEVTEYMRHVNTRSHAIVMDRLASRGALDPTASRWAVTSSASVFMPGAFDLRYIGIYEYAKSKVELANWALAYDAPCESLTILFPSTVSTPMSSGANVIASNDPPRRVVGDDRMLQGPAHIPSLASPWTVELLIGTPPFATAFNLARATEERKRWAFTYAGLNQTLFRWVFPATPWIAGWFVTSESVWLTLPLSRILLLALSSPPLLLTLLPQTGWPIALLQFFLPGGPVFFDKAPALAPRALLWLRALLFNYALLELWFATLRVFGLAFSPTAALVHLVA